MVIDWDHYSPNRVAQLLAELLRLLGKGYSTFVISGWLTPIQLIGISVAYTVNIPATASDDFVIGVLLGVWLDFQKRFEYAQGFLPGTSSFSPEDLVTDYLGFVDGVTDLGPGDIIAELRGGFGTNDKGPYIGSQAETSLDISELPEALQLSPVEEGFFWNHSQTDFVYGIGSFNVSLTEIYNFLGPR